MSGQRREVDLEPAFVLHGRAYRDSSAILEVFSEGYGRVGLVGRGVRGPKSRWRGILQPFVPLLLSWRGRGELATLTHAEAVGGLSMPGGARVASGFYLNELLLRLLKREDPHPGAFHVYHEALTRLLEDDGPPAPALRLFEKRLLDELGYGLMLDTDAAGRPVVADAWYHCEPEAAPVAVEGPAAPGLVVAGASLLCLAADRVPDDKAAADVKRLMRAALAPHLGARPLKSRELYRQMAAVKGAAAGRGEERAGVAPREDETGGR